MSIDQTSQLIQLMLNSVLMMALCGAVTTGLILRQSAVVSQLRLFKPLYGNVVNGMRSLSPERFLQLKAQLRRLRRQYRLAFLGGWSASGALILCAGSTLLLALRSLILLNLLIPISLLLFAGGAALLLLGLVLGLLSLVGADELGNDRFHDAAESLPGRSRLPAPGGKCEASPLADRLADRLAERLAERSSLGFREAAQAIDRTLSKESLSAQLPSYSASSPTGGRSRQQVHPSHQPPYQLKTPRA